MSRNVRTVLFVEPQPKRRRAFPWAVAILAVSSPATALGLYIIAQTVPAKLAQLAQVWP